MSCCYKCTKLYIFTKSLNIYDPPVLSLAPSNPSCSPVAVQVLGTGWRGEASQRPRPPLPRPFPRTEPRRTTGGARSYRLCQESRRQPVRLFLREHPLLRGPDSASPGMAQGALRGQQLPGDEGGGNSFEQLGRLVTASNSHLFLNINIQGDGHAYYSLTFMKGLDAFEYPCSDPIRPLDLRVCLRRCRRPEWSALRTR